MDKDIAAAAIERLEAEKQRRIDEKVAKGEAVRVPLSLVIHDPEQVEAEIESAKASKLAELRKAGETREIVFDPPLTISTGVPRNADFGKGWAPLTASEALRPVRRRFGRASKAGHGPALRGAGRAACGAPHTSTGRAADRKRSGRDCRGKLHAYRGRRRPRL
jgi:hypothetical protein